MIFGVEIDNKTTIPNGLKSKGFEANVEGSKTIHDKYLNYLLFKLKVDHVWGTETQVKDLEPTATFYTDVSGNALDKNDASVSFFDDDRIVMVHNVTLVANLSLDCQSKRLRIRTEQNNALSLSTFTINFLNPASSEITINTDDITNSFDKIVATGITGTIRLNGKKKTTTFSSNISEKSANYSVQDFDYLLKADSSSGSFDFTLQPIAQTIGQQVSFLKESSDLNQIDIKDSGGNDVTSINTQGEKVTLFNDGVSWVVVDRYIPSEWISLGPTIIQGLVANPTKGGVITDDILLRRSGDSAEVVMSYSQSSSGTAGSGDYSFLLPTGYVIDSSKISQLGSVVSSVGTFHGRTSDLVNYIRNLAGNVFTVNSNTLRVYAQFGQDGAVVTGGSAVIGSFFESLYVPDLTYNLNLKVPIVGWKG